MLYLKRTFVSILLCIVLLLCTGCPLQTQMDVPESGAWYCEELRLQLSLNDYEQSYLIENDERLICGFGFSHHKKTSCSVSAQHLGHPTYELSEDILSGTITDINENSFVIKTKDKKKYTFVRVDKNTDADQIPSYGIEIDFDFATPEENIGVIGDFDYPILSEEGKSYEEINHLIKPYMYDSLKTLIDDERIDSSVLLACIITFTNNQFACFQFEGSVEAGGYVAFALNISVPDAGVIDPTTYFELDRDFVGVFLTRLKKQLPNCRFTDEQWDEILAYMEELSSDEILQILQSDPVRMIALEKEAITVLFPLPHELGDYAKVTVPYAWNSELTN